MILRREICTKCHRVFDLSSSESKTLCSPCFDDAKSQADCVPNVTCKSCFERFYSPNLLKICPFCHKKGITMKNARSPQKYDPKKDYNPSNRLGKTRKVSLEELIRRQEWKRVMDEDAWDHYLSGRKWDKI